MLFLIVLFAAAILIDSLWHNLPVVTLSRDRRFRCWIEDDRGRRIRKTIAPLDADCIPIPETGAHFSVNRKAPIGYYVCLHDTDGSVVPLRPKPHYLFGTGERISAIKHKVPIVTLLCAVCVLAVMALAPVVRSAVVTPLFSEVGFTPSASSAHWWSEEPAEEKTLHNILLIGTDGRGTSEDARADAIFLVSINEDLACAKLITLQRDLRVEGYNPYLMTFSEYAEAYGLTEDDPDYAMKRKQLPKDKYVTGKLNSCFTFQQTHFPTEMTEAQRSEAAYISGCESLVFNVEKVFGIYVDGYLATDMESITHFVDALGGITYPVPDEEYRTQLEKLTLAHNAWYGFEDHFDAVGDTHLTGGMFLAYFRLRHVGNWSDTERTERQRALIAALVSQKLDPETLPQTLKSLDHEAVKQAFGGMHTNIDTDYMEYLYSLLFKAYTLDFDNMLPRENEYEEVRVYHTDYVVVPEWFTPLSRQVTELLYGTN